MMSMLLICFMKITLFLNVTVVSNVIELVFG